MNRTAKELAELIGATLEGDGAAEVHGVAAPERAGARDLIYVDAAKHAERAGASAAQVAVAPPGVALSGKTVLRASNAKYAFAKAASVLRERVPIARGVHPTAIIAPLARVHPTASVGPYAVIGEDAHVGEFTEIGAHSVIGPGCWIGSHCRVHPRVTLYASVRIGHRVEIHSGAVIGADGFGYAHGEGRYLKFPQAGIVEIGDDVEIGANATIDRGSLDDTRISQGVKLDNLVHVGHNVKIGANTVIAAQTGVSGSSTIGDNVIVGGQVGIADHCTLESGSVAGAQAGIPTGKTIRRGQTVWGTPAREIDKFKEIYVWYARLPELAERIKELEAKVGES
ncbi:MAG: UDP-3-O-(3-hydroxymyristoyl)glucosamine N-acyltransferase [Acidobacteria bacterium]|nr:UDP-3-O-(3-hydroxymyristoyl)glucosamine N-acyltransferase [Acidobacteriota bacterium]MBS1865240.1 UDP-3-O-(3-hydroxymyristoyl)glucosamine N-acyltransferase [Acidobacteriota bacterium]